MKKVGSRSPVRGQALPLLGVLASLLAVPLLRGAFGLAPGELVPGAGARVRAAAGSVLYVPAGAHAAGANGANWRTDVEVLNTGSASASFTIQLLRRDANNASPASRSYSLGANQSRRFGDILLSEFGTDGAAALRFLVASGSIVVTSRTYNLVGPNPWGLPQGASFGQFVPGLDETEAIGYGQEGRLIHLTQRPSGDLDGFRTNVGIVNASAIPIDVRVDFYRADGTWLGKRDGSDTNLPPYGFRQLDQAFGAWGTLADGYAIVKPTTAGGALFAFATVIDNHVSGDPIFVPAARRTASATTPTPTPTPTPPPSGSFDLVPYKPSGWENPIVPDLQPGSLATSFLSAHMNTYVRWAVLNQGTADIPGTVRFELRIDGTRYAGWKSDTGLKAGYYIYVEDFLIPYDTLTPGAHTLTIVGDYDNAVAESNESNNTWGKSWEWSSIVFRAPGGGGATKASPGATGEDRPLPAPRRAETPALSAAPLAAAAGTVYVPASAHASGVNGASWRTDVEVHNPGTTAVGFQVALLRQASDNGGSVPTRTFSLGPQQSVRYVDILASMFQTDGAAALRLVPDGGATILVNSRTYNLIGPNGVGLPVGASFSQFVPGLDESASAIAYGEEGRIPQLSHRDPSSLTDFRTNVGYVNTTGSPIDLRIDLYSAAGALLGTVQDDRTRLRAFESRQVNAVFGEFTGSLDDGYAVLRTTTPGGRFLAFATVIDNHLTGDPVFVPAQKVSTGGTTVGSGSIGAAGGTVSGGGLTVTVPGGAFSQPATLTIRRGASAATPMEKFRTTEVFQLEGLPDERAREITVTLDVTRSVTVSGADFVAAAGEVFVPSAAALGSPPMLIKSTRAGSKVTATIPAATGPTTGGADGPEPLAADPDVRQTFTIWGITGYAELVSAQGHFRVNYPVTDLVLGGAEEVAKGLESAYTKLAALSFDWTRRSSWPVYVSMASFPPESATRLAETVPSRWGINSYWIHVNTDRLNAQADIPLMQEAAAHELLHLAQFLYDPRNRISMARDPGKWLWADEATSVWFENVYSGKSTPPQVVRENHAFMTRHGLEYAPGDDPTVVQDHGYGAALLMRDLAKRKGDAAVAELVRRKSNSQVLPVDAYDLQTGASAESTWRLFVDEYARGHLYTGFPTPADLWVTTSGNRYAFASSADAGKTFDWAAPDLSARLYGIQFTDTSWAPGTSVVLELTDERKDAISLVYTLKGGALTSLGYHVHGEPFTVPNAEAFAKDGTSLLVIVANGRAVSPYTGTTPISLNVSAGGRNELKFYVPGTDCVAGPTLAWSFWNTFTPDEVTWSGNRVTASWSGSLFPGNQSEYTGTATLSDDRQTLLSLEYTSHFLTTSTGTNCTVAGCRSEGWQSITFAGVGKAADWRPALYHFATAGTGARAKITSASMRDVWTGFSLSTQNHDCTYAVDETRAGEIRFDMWLSPPP